jgi:hypothetical protein
MRKLLSLSLLVVVSALLLAGCGPDPDSPQLTKTELSSFLGESSDDGTGSGEQLGILDEDRAFGTVDEAAAARGISSEDVIAIKAALAASFEMSAEEIEITVERDSSADYVTGYVNVGEGERGGIYFAARTKDGWEIAHNGTGIIECEKVDVYGFPTGLIPRCFDQTSGQNIDR